MQALFRWLWLIFISLVLVACSTVRPAAATNQASAKAPKNTVPSTKGGGYFQNDGPADHIPVNLDLVPDAVPQDEPLIRSANLPYTALGMSFTPDVSAKAYRKRGKASWYGKQFQGRKTSSGERYDMFAMTAAHPTLPIPSYARVTNLKNGESVIVRINDRGPFHKSRLMDLSYAAAHKLGYINQGSADVLVERVFPVEGETRLATRPPVQQQPVNEAQPVYLQLGAFARLANAESRLKQLTAEVDDQYDDKLAIVNQDGLYKLRLGPFSSQSAAEQAASALDVQLVVMR